MLMHAHSSSYLQLYKACGDDDVEQAAIALAASQNNGEANILNQNNLSGMLLSLLKATLPTRLIKLCDFRA